MRESMRRGDWVAKVSVRRRDREWAEGVRPVGVEGVRVVFDVGSERHHFRVTR